MNCPVCKEPSMQKEKVLGNVTIDKCTKCQGIMFEKDEIGYYLKFSKDIPDFANVVKDAQKSEKRCCFCSTEMIEFKYARDMDLLVDFCQGCESIWLDGDEILQLTSETEDPDNIKMRIARSIFKMRQKSGQDALPIKCPVCRTASLRPFKTSENVEVDLCDNCSGMWFDKGELANSLELSVDIPHFDKVIDAATPADKICPKCDVDMIEFEYAQGSGLMIDYCKKCCSVWLDGGELKHAEDLSAELESTGKRFGKILTDMKKDGYSFLKF